MTYAPPDKILNIDPLTSPPDPAWTGSDDGSNADNWFWDFFSYPPGDILTSDGNILESGTNSSSLDRTLGLINVTNAGFIGDPGKGFQGRFRAKVDMEPVANNVQYYDFYENTALPTPSHTGVSFKFFYDGDYKLTLNTNVTILFNWNDGNFHVYDFYKISKSGNIYFFIDGSYVATSTGQNAGVDTISFQLVTGKYNRSWLDYMYSYKFCPSLPYVIAPNKFAVPDKFSTP